MTPTCFIPFKKELQKVSLPLHLNDPFSENISLPEICTLAVKELQSYIQLNEKDWPHDFGLGVSCTHSAKGKMFGVLVVQNQHDELGYLSTFSGKFQTGAHPTIFVPSVFDIATNDNFISKGMRELKAMSNKIKLVEQKGATRIEISSLKEERKQKSIRLQEELFTHYVFFNEAKIAKDLISIFNDYQGKKPPAGAGECSAPKLLQYAYLNQLKPIAIAEFWWGKSTPSGDRIHKNFYPACRDKCRPILTYMLSL